MSRRVLRGCSAQEFTAIRTRAGLSVSDLDRIADVAVSTIHHWEAGTRSPQATSSPASWRSWTHPSRRSCSSLPTIAIPATGAS
ncbi:MAG TPA: helix-turn-helix transcriptional regulator [Mycobacterium sp.]|nr:helix-turn-helix transcriptional regulator [Mycobacterium sp.]